eukprot:GHUV01016198.1.p1 GENE.GHUV01016198.1~~GHUV01016198.1.p1  ORF type:complete len:245 (+),score=117.92 GHUV01016198.1:1379-2113(+)
MASSVEFCGGTHLINTAQAKAFALLSEEGIAKGVRRIVAVTADDAAAAIAEGERLARDVEQAAALPDTHLEKALVPLKSAVDVAVIPAATKAEIRDRIAALIKRAMDAAKAAAAANKEAATAAAVAAADEAVAAGQGYVVLQLQVGVDPKAVTEAWGVIEKKHGDKVAALFVSVDEVEGKALAYAGVPAAVSSKLKANEWVNSALAVLGGKGGGKPTAAQGQGSNVDKAAEALQVAEQFASMKL